MKVQGQFKRRAHIASLILVHIGVGQRCRALNVESPALLPTTSTRNVPAGRWMKGQGKGGRRAHIISEVVMDIAAFKVSHCVERDIDATALPVTRARSLRGALDRYKWVQFARKLSPRAATIHTANSEHTIGALGSRSIQKASRQCQPDYCTRWCWSALPCPRWRVPRPPANHEHT